MKQGLFNPVQETGLPEPTEEMQQYFITRTNKHIDRIKNNMALMEGYQGLVLEELTKRAAAHDSSKFSVPERTGYVWLTWRHHCKKSPILFEYPKGIEIIVKQAIEHHLKNNRHHHKFHEDANKMTSLDMVEMICDWTAMSQEYNQDSIYVKCQ